MSPSSEARWGRTGWKVIFMLHSKEVQIDFHLSCTFCFIILTLSNFFFCFRVFCSIENLKVCRNKKKLLRKKRFYVAFCVKFVCSLNKINVKIRLKEMRRVRGFGAYHDPGNGTDINQTTEKSFWLSTYLQHATLRISSEGNLSFISRIDWWVNKIRIRHWQSFSRRWNAKTFFAAQKKQIILTFAFVDFVERIERPRRRYLEMFLHLPFGGICLLQRYKVSFTLPTANFSTVNVTWIFCQHKPLGGL